MLKTLPKAAVAALALSVAPLAAQAQDTLRAVTAFPSALAFSQSFLGFVDLVNERGEGIVQIEHIGGPEAVPQMQQMDALRRGVVDMQYGPASFHLGRMPEGDAFTGSTITSMEARENGGFELMQQAFRDRLGVELLAHIDSGVQFHIYLTREPRRTEDGGVDFNGLQIRSAPIYNAFFEALGATPITVAVPDVYTGLERNTFDGAGWPMIGIRDLNWDRFLRYRIDPGFMQTDLSIAVNRDAWNRLSDEARALLTELSIEYEQISFDQFQEEIAATDAAVREGGMTVIELEGEARARFLDMAYDSVWDRMEAAGSPMLEELRALYYTR